MLKPVCVILCLMVLTDARQNLDDLRVLESNIRGIAAYFLEAEHINDIRTISNVRSKYIGHVAILQHSNIFSSFIGHSVDRASLLNLPVSKIEWGDLGRQYAFVLGKSSIDSPEEVEKVLSETLKAAIDYLKSFKGELASIHCME